jgi:hypothetical protein
VQASVGKYFKTLALAQTPVLPSLVEGVEDRTETFAAAPDKIEIRVNGPHTKDYGNSSYSKVFVNLLLTHTIGGAGKNQYKHDTDIGIFYEAAGGPIPVYKLGSEDDDDLSHLGCLIAESGNNDYIRVNKFGQLEENTPLRQAMISVTYRLEL